MKHTVYKIFPDYCSTGVWSEKGNVEVPEWLPPEYHIALEYWHKYWEYVISDWSKERYNQKHNRRTTIKWFNDGERLVECLNAEAKAQGRFVRFIYDVEGV